MIDAPRTSALFLAGEVDPDDPTFNEVADFCWRPREGGHDGTFSPFGQFALDSVARMLDEEIDEDGVIELDDPDEQPPENMRRIRFFDAEDVFPEPEIQNKEDT